MSLKSALHAEGDESLGLEVGERWKKSASYYIIIYNNNNKIYNNIINNNNNINILFVILYFIKWENWKIIIEIIIKHK